MELPAWKIEQRCSVDSYCNVSRYFRTYRGDSADKWCEHIVIHSGSSGIAIHTKGQCWIPAEIVLAVAKELIEAVPFSADAKRDASAYWAAKNGSYDHLKEIRAKWEKK